MTGPDNAKVVSQDDDDYFTSIDRESPEQSLALRTGWLGMMFSAVNREAGLDVESLHDLQHGGNRAAVPALTRFLYSIPSRNLQCAVIHILGRKQYRPDSVDVLIQAYRDFAGAHAGGGSRMQWYIASAIDGPVSEKQIDEIFGLIEELPSKLDAGFLLNAVARTKKQRERAVLLTKEVLEMALETNKDPDDPAPNDAVNAVTAAGKLRDPRLYSPLKVMADTPNTWMRDRVKRALAQCEPKQENAT
ncbi:Uncharacterised protein [Mycobacteroides abscessus subsp. abscessus]|uniref:Uncharacterized protein n=2 Tax=Mycobacteroides abscessus TaxID=36809 RepID=A0AB33TFB7_9MYCO|nr:hypothetical protein [Mycobacteroides abscessus]MBN7531893.1 hypothetical protein [Mycobacteroides abscessus subsp. abscessus]MDO3086091.1 hypothetical protein [Mycobacteroides abscessus subsp. abscessus]MDO3105285.1 hypothetical protein [Mycobacteroides abscessus subsp. abscessus]PVA86597.1 hypothetical protein DDJ47_21315 [Mycobacteroides abscessus]RIT09878.1 hypothetical protein D2E74_04395 [Mycobacteroides abscessus]